MKKKELRICLPKDLSTRALNLDSTLPLYVSITRLIPSNVKKDIPIGNGTVSKKWPMPFSVSKNVVASNGEYLKKANTERLITTPRVAKRCR